MTATIYGAADIAAALSVTRAAVSNWLIRDLDTPTPQFMTIDGRVFWDDAGLAEWVRWERNRKRNPRDETNVERERRKTMQHKVAEIRLDL